MDPNKKFLMLVAAASITPLVFLRTLIKRDLDKSLERQGNIYAAAITVMEKIQRGEYVDKEAGQAKNDYELELIRLHEED